MTDGFTSNLYDLLGLNCHASANDIARQFIKLSHLTSNLNEKLQIYQAYKVLSCPNQRRAYDKTLLLGLLTETTQLASTSTRLIQQPIQHYTEQAHPNEDSPLLISTAENKREYPRLPFDSQLLINDSLQAHTLNISPKGAKIELPPSFDEQGVVTFRSNCLRGIAKICFVKNRTQQGCCAGLYFLNVHFAPQLIINEYV